METIPEKIDIEIISELLEKYGFIPYEQEKKEKKDKLLKTVPKFDRQHSSSIDFQNNKDTIFFIKLDNDKKLEKLYIKLDHKNMREIFNNINCKIIDNGYLTIGLNFDKIQIEYIKLTDNESYGYIYQK